MDENSTTKEGRDPSNEQQEVVFKYVKSNFFRVIHADGAWGGLNPRGNIHMSFYNERAALPDTSTLTISSDGNLVKPEEPQTSGAVIREIECDVILDLRTAIGLRKWLDDQIKQLQELIKEAQQQQREKSKEQKPIASKTG
jgi:hypothetical protein